MMDNSQKNRRGLFVEVLTLIAAGVIAFAALIFTWRQKIDLPNLALQGNDNIQEREWYEGMPYTASSVKEIKEIISAQEIKRLADPEVRLIVWLGMSQLYTINQRREGDHISPYWLRQSWRGAGSLEPLGCGLPNADAQEYLVLCHYATERIPVHLVIAALVFDKFREDGVRSDFSEILTPELSRKIRDSSTTAADVMQRYLSSNQSSMAGNATVQQTVESLLNSRMAASWKLWADRPQIEGNFLVDLYDLRNWVCGINPTTVRRTIPLRYKRNTDALKDMLDFLGRRGIPVLLYIAPIRQDKPIPYDMAEYSSWKAEMGSIAHSYEADFVNLEKLVPDGDWGAYRANNIDFMHFQGAGHRLVAQALLPYVKKMLPDGRH